MILNFDNSSLDGSMLEFLEHESVVKFLVPVEQPFVLLASVGLASQSFVEVSVLVQVKGEGVLGVSGDLLGGAHVIADFEAESA